MANNKLFHAAALHKLFVLWKEQKKTILPKDLQRWVYTMYMYMHVCIIYMYMYVAAYIWNSGPITYDAHVHVHVYVSNFTTILCMCGSIASRVLLATLCVPIEPTPSDVDRFLEVDQAGRDKARRLAALLRMNTLPTRASLLRDIVCVVCVFTCTHTHTHTSLSHSFSTSLFYPPSL